MIVPSGEPVPPPKNLPRGFSGAGMFLIVVLSMAALIVQVNIPEKTKNLIPSCCAVDSDGDIILCQQFCGTLVPVLITTLVVSVIGLGDSLFVTFYYPRMICLFLYCGVATAYGLSANRDQGTSGIQNLGGVYAVVATIATISFGLILLLLGLWSHNR